MPEELKNEVRITLEGRDIPLPMEPLGLTMDSTDRQILDAIRPVIQAQEGMDLADDQDEYTYTVRKALNSGTIYVYPKPVAG